LYEKVNKVGETIQQPDNFSTPVVSGHAFDYNLKLETFSPLTIKANFHVTTMYALSSTKPNREINSC
jgi:hypothetical protein